MDRRAWPAAVCGVTKSETQLRDWTTTTTNSKNKAVCIHAHTHTHTHTHFCAAPADTHTLLHSSKCLMKMFNFQIRTNCRDKFLRIDAEEDYSQIWLLCSICITKLQSVICHFKSLSTVYLLLLLTWFIKPSYTAVMNACITGHEIKKKSVHSCSMANVFSKERMPNTFMDYFFSLDFHCQNSQLLIISSNHIAIMWARHCSKPWTSINLFDLHSSPLSYLREAKWFSQWVAGLEFEFISRVPTFNHITLALIIVIYQQNPTCT